MQLSGNSVDHLNFFINKLKNQEPFAFVRPGDGEYMVMVGRHFTTPDNWTFSGGSLISDLMMALTKAAQMENMYVGIPCPDCQGAQMKQWYINTFNLQSERTTYANIVCNANWKLFTNYLLNENKPFYYIGPGKESSKLNVLDRYIIDDKQVNRWDAEKNSFLAGIESWIDNIISQHSNTTPLLFLFSAGPLAKILVVKFFQKYPSHCFLDCGSALDFYIKGTNDRLFLYDDRIYSRLVCDLDKGHSFLN